MGHFLPSPHLQNPQKNQNFEKKICWRYHHFTHVYQKPQSYEVQFLRFRVRQTEFFVILCHFSPFYPPPPRSLENQNFEKMEQASGDVIILHISTKNHDHMIYASKDMECDRHIFLSFWAIFCPFTPLLTLKIKIWKKFRKKRRYYPLRKCQTNEDHMMYGS